MWCCGQRNKSLLTLYGSRKVLWIEFCGPLFRTRRLQCSARYWSNMWSIWFLAFEIYVVFFYVVTECPEIIIKNPPSVPHQKGKKSNILFIMTLLPSMPCSDCAISSTVSAGTLTGNHNSSGNNKNIYFYLCGYTFLAIFNNAWCCSLIHKPKRFEDFLEAKEKTFLEQRFRQ